MSRFAVAVVVIAVAVAGAPTTLEDAERDHILRVLEQTQWRVQGQGGAAERRRQGGAAESLVACIM